MRKEQESYALQYPENDRASSLRYRDFFPSPMQMRLCGPPPYHRVRIIPDEAGDYWTWWDSEKDDFHFTAFAKMAVEICFPYGSKAEEDRGRGKLIRCRVEPIA